jgi:hypothetical protein
MKRCLSWMFALSLWVGTATAQESSLASTDPAAHVPAPHLTCDAPEFDFGTMDNSQTVEHTFVLRNTGDLSLEITQARPSCGCTVASISERTVAPGAESRITARLSLAGRQGPQHKVVTVESNDPKQPQFALTLRGVAGVALDVQPPRIMQGQLPAGSQPTNELQVSGQGDTPFQIIALEATSDRLQASVETVETGHLYRVRVWPTQPLAPGQLDANLVIRTDHPQRPTLEVPVVFMVSTDITVAPRELVFPTVSEEPVTRYIIVRAAEGQTFQIANVETPNPEIKTEISPFGSNGFRIQLSGLRPQVNLHQRVIRINTSIPGQPPLDVPIRVIPAEAPPPAPAP